MSIYLASVEVLLQGKNYSGSGNWLDESGNSHDATPVDTPTFRSDHFVLNGSSQYLEIADHDNLDFADGEDFTAMVALRSYTVTGGQDTILAKRTTTSGSAGTVGWLLRLNNAAVGIILDDGVTAPSDANTLIINQYAVVVGRRDDTTPEVEAFLDGVGSGSPGTGNAGDLTNAEVIRIGAKSGAAGNYFNGEIYAVALWRALLTDAEIVLAGQELAGEKRLLLGVGR